MLPWPASDGLAILQAELWDKMHSTARQATDSKLHSGTDADGAPSEQVRASLHTMYVVQQEDNVC